MDGDALSGQYKIGFWNGTSFPSPDDTGDAGRLTVDVVSDGKATHVTLSDESAPPGQQGRMNADRGFTTVTFEPDDPDRRVLERQALVFHPFRNGPGQRPPKERCSVLRSKVGTSLNSDEFARFRRIVFVKNQPVARFAK
ncbi:hypothetical protein [Paraburkholderia tropica]|uniref:hypothetical protein n=1 Tax=Paraburkholderia tropica TaxID=92647 RepID=UPI001F30869F|nr:hypothetical protein [Paraburkholderia tropica]